MSLKTFEHVLILADDLKKTKEFYVDLLGLKDGYRPDFPFPGHWLYLNEDDKAACIHLAMRKQGDGQDYYIGKKDNVKSGSGAGPESVPRDTKSTAFAKGRFQPFNFRNSFRIR